MIPWLVPASRLACYRTAEILISEQVALSYRFPSATIAASFTDGDRDMRKFLLVASLSLAFSTAASTSYTKEQLNSMAASGQYPEQESPVTKSVQVVDFDHCKQDAYNIFSQISDSYPANVIVDTNVLYIVKFWTNDGTVMISCSEPDGKKVVTSSAYK